MRNRRIPHRVKTRCFLRLFLVKPKQFNFLWALFWFLMLVVGLLIYLLYYIAKKDEQIYLTVDEQGKIHRQ